MNWPNGEMMDSQSINRRDFCQQVAGASAVTLLGTNVLRAESKKGAYKLNYIVASPMYGTTALAEVLPEVKKCDSTTIDIWPRSHANHREQVKEMGHERFQELLKKNGVKLGISTRYDLGPFRLKEEVDFVQKMGGKLIVCGSGKGTGNTLKEKVKTFVASMQEHVAYAADHGVTIGIEDHANSLINTPESMDYFADYAKSDNLGIALAPYHMPQEPDTIAKTIATLGKSLVHFQAWEHGMGCHKKMPKEQELLQMPGRGELDFVPILRALKNIKYTGWTEIFMHPTPRGIPILETTDKVTAEINRSRAYLSKCLLKV